MCQFMGLRTNDIVQLCFELSARQSIPFLWLSSQSMALAMPSSRV